MTPDEEFLEKRGWVRNTPLYLTHWCWKQPKTGAMFSLQDAVDVQRALDKGRNERRRPKTSVSPAVPEEAGHAQ